MSNGGNWSNILEELKEVPSKYDAIRHKYYKELVNLIDRNVLCYYSGWQQGKSASIDINDEDMEGIMSTVNGMEDKAKGLTLIMHTPGGDPNAAESIVLYLRELFDDDIEVIVPHMAMSAGTMMACASKKIIMGKHSSLGPVDPQFNGLPAYNILSEFKQAHEELHANSDDMAYWNILLSKYPPAFVKSAEDAVELSGELIKQWLSGVMFKNENAGKTIDTIVRNLNEHKKSKAHARHFNHQEVKEMGLKVELLEDNQDLQNLVLSLHHAFILTLQQTTASKIIEGPKSSYIIGEAQD